MKNAFIGLALGAFSPCGLGWMLYKGEINPLGVYLTVVAILGTAAYFGVFDGRSTDTGS